MPLSSDRVLVLVALLNLLTFTSIALAADPLPPLLEKRATRTTCSITTKTPSPRYAICNQQGSIQSPAPIETTVASSLQICENRCLNLPRKCISFSYGPGTQCVTYSKVIKGSGFKRGQTGMTFWNHHCFSKKCGLCPGSLSPCSGFCYDLQTDDSHCGRCTNTCQSGSACQSGSCLCPNGDLPSLCSNSCPDYQTDNNNCGNCGHICQDGTACSGGNCVCASGQLGDNDNCGTCGNTCTQGTSCSGGNCICSSGQLGDNNNCGTCGNVCTQGTSCSGGNCICSSGQLGDNNNCGTCGNVCTKGTSCSGGNCICSSGQLGDNNNCGTCGNVCTKGTNCSGGNCVCSSGQLGDNNNCGTCGTTCTQGTSCSGGNCVCSSGQLGDNNNCGTCGNICRSGSTCQSGACKCADGSAVSSLQTNINDCGTCGNKCIGSGVGCSNGNCACSDQSKTYCPQVGCTSTLSFSYDSNNCGGCGRACNSGQICSKSQCIADPGSCNNRGVQWAYLANIDGINNDDTYSTFKPEHYSSGQPILHTGQIQQIGSWTETSDMIYNSGLSAGATYYVVNHRGYIFAPLDGSYTVTIGLYIDDIACFWIGLSAYSGYTRDNAAICRGAGIDFFSGPHQTSITMAAGTYYPFRVMYGQAQENVYFTISIVHDNSGLSIISGSSNSAYPWVITQGCTGNPPAFKAFGSES